jgi:hypothetical protein
MASLARNDVDDFEAFLEPDFNPQRFVNDLIVGVNGNDCDNLDLVTPIKKLKFDIEECNKRMEKIANGNYESLVENFNQIETAKQLLKATINPSVERVNLSFERIQSEVILPYDEAVKLNTALKKIHKTVEILRGASFFIIMIQQLQSLEESNNPVKLARLHNQLTQIYETEATSTLLPIKLIRNFQGIQFTKKTKLFNDATNTVTNDINHHSSFNDKNETLQSNLQVLYILNPKDFFLVLEKASLNRQVQLASTQLQRSLQSPRNFTEAISEIKENAEEYFRTLMAILSKCTPKDEDLESLALKFYNTPLIDIFWQRVALKFKKNVAATMARGGPIAKNLKLYNEGLNKTVKDTFQDTPEQQLLLDALSIILGAL